VVVAAIIPPIVIDDPDDDAVLACAVSAKANLVVSGDPHLLRMADYQGVPIVTPAEGVARLGL
jgi:predicted nucleic acid-binding protein